MKSIIFIPGIEATALANANSFDFNLVWNAFDTLGTSLGNKVTGPYLENALQLEPLYDENIDYVVERNHLARLPYETALQGLKQKLGASLYLFGYDWRLSNAENGKRLKKYFDYLRTKIQNILKPGDENKFYFLTHSMGGLVFMNFVNELASTDFNDIGKVVMCVPPLKGSPYALIHMVQEESGFKGFINSLLNRTIDVRKVMRTFPSIYELLPTYEGALRFADDNSPVELLDINNWQSNLIEKDDNGQSLKLMQNRLQSLAVYRNNKLKFSDVLGDKTIIVAGEGDMQTCTEIKVARNQNKTKNFLLLNKNNITWGTGDGTVPLVSSTALKDKVLTLAVNHQSVFEQPGNVSYHGLFLQDSRVQNIIKRYFESDKLYTTDSDITDLKSIGEGVRNANDGLLRIYN